MNRAIVAATLRQRFTSPMRVALLLFFSLPPLLGALFMPAAGLSLLGDSYGVALVFAAGMIGQDVSSGTLQLLLARPVRRSEYVLSRGLAAVLGTLAVVWTQIAIAVLLLAARGATPATRDVLALAGGDALLAIGMAAVMALLSSLVPGLADLGLLLITNVTASALGAFAQFKHWEALARGAQEIGRFLKPEVSLAPLLLGGAVSWFEVVSWLSTVTLCLALAIVVTNRRELSYASS
ncbi:MAG: ABC transporter permease subunit [Planctomycetota bacterium]